MTSPDTFTAQDVTEKTQAVGCDSTWVKAPRFIVHVDAPAHKRWQHVILAFKKEFVHAQDYLLSMFPDTMVGKLVSNGITGVLGWLNQSGLVLWKDELTAIAKDSGLELGQVVALQVAYEAAACCTSIVTNDAKSNLPIHIRSMDWGAKFLSRMTIEVDFRRQNKTVFVASTWAGYVGVLTGFRPGVFGVSINFRTVGDGILKNLESACRKSWPVGFLVRHVCEQSNRYKTFEDAVYVLSNTPTIAPFYAVLSGAKIGQGTIITRNRSGFEHPWTLTKDGPCVQANRDHWISDMDDKALDILNSRQRRAVANQFLKDHVATMDMNELWKCASLPPIQNSITVYVSAMVSAINYFETRIPMHGTAYQSDDFYRCSHAVQWVEPEPTVYNCDRCKTSFIDATNRSGQCIHTGQWHSRYAQCNLLVCGFHLGLTQLGRAHWSCCFSTHFSSLCPKSAPHISATS